MVNNDHRETLPPRYARMNPRPICSHCHKFMAVVKTTKVHLIGRDGNYIVYVEYYRCKHAGCPGCKVKWIRAPNPYAGMNMIYDYEVQAEICQMRWKEHATYEEIVDRINKRFGIDLDKTVVELITKTYEIGCSREYRQQYLDDIDERGGIMLCIDVMEPLQGQDGFLVAYDAWSKLTFGSYRMPNNKQATYERFLTHVKDRIANEIGAAILGIISDALPAEREAIANVFPGIPQCLCHYHFFNLVLKTAKQLDSKVVTQLREELRKLYDLRQYQLRVHAKNVDASQYAHLSKFLDPLVELSNWRRKPNDPCLVGIELNSRIHDIFARLCELQALIDLGRIRHFPALDTRVVNRMVPKLFEILSGVELDISVLLKVRGHLEPLVDILDEAETSAEDGIQKMQQYCDNLRLVLDTLPEVDVEYQFIEALLKFFDTKGELLFNYRNILHGPTTNNDLELRFKQLKHLIRRIIGHAAAKHYLMMHGERIFYVNPEENFDQIVEILRNTDQLVAHNQIRLDRLSNNRLGLIIHDEIRWSRVLDDLDQYLTELESFQ